MAERLSRRLVLLSSAAIGAVYLAGYLDTRTAGAGLASTTSSGTTSDTTSTVVAPDTAAVQVQATTPATSSVLIPTSTSSDVAASPVRQAAAPPPTATAKPAPTATAVPTGLRDGTFTGAGDSRRGAIQAALTIKAGRITNVTITGASTQYPVAWISTLPGEVVATQSAQVDLVSGATYSSLAFEGAVRQALAQAQA